GVGVSGFAELAALDSDGDGLITVADVAWSELQVWQDFDLDGVTDEGELTSLDELGIVSLDAIGQPLDATTAQGTQLTGFGDVVFENGIRRTMFDSILDFDDVETRYAGESGRADWQAGQTLDARGFGSITNLSIAMANDIALEELATTTAAAMTTPDLAQLAVQVGDVLGKWGAAQELTRELTPVFVGSDGQGNAVLLDRGVYVEDQDGGYWTLASGVDIIDSQGVAIDRPSLEDVLAQSDGWRLEQQWSPSDRAEALTHREAAPYLAQIIDGRAVILDYGIEQPDGTWALASDPSTTYATVQDILALDKAQGTEWRAEELGFNPIASVPVEQIGVRFTDGQVVDYTVEVTDRDGTFYVWARNLDRAIELEWKTGDYREFNLRNFAIEFENLDEVGSTDDSTYRVEILTPAQLNFATSLGGVDFRPELLSATLNDDTGTIDYAVGPTGSANLSTDPSRFVSGINEVIGLLGPVMTQYITVSRRLAVRLALQGGLSDYADGFEYDVELDAYLPTTERQLAPLFEAIFADAPASNEGDAVYDYLTDWNEILWQIYPDYISEVLAGLEGGGGGVNQAFIIQMLLPAFENVGVDLDLRGIANALSIDETRIIDHLESETDVTGTSGIDYFYLSSGDQNISGGAGTDFYFVGRDSGNDVIFDQDDGGADELRFTDVFENEVTAIRDGQDLILQIEGRENVIRLTDQFLGELNPFLSNGVRLESGVDSIVFADGVVWDRFRMSIQVVDRDRAEGDFNDSVLGSGDSDILWGGRGNDYLSGGAGGDYYVFELGDGQDVIDDRGTFSFGTVQAGIDFLRFRGDISAENL
ncbi:MAG: calcium-binding protein, partial [Pseudomonadota bacterium]